VSGKPISFSVFRFFTSRQALASYITTSLENNMEIPEPLKIKDFKRNITYRTSKERHYQLYLSVILCYINRTARKDGKEFNMNEDVSKKSKLAAALLCNPFGCHRFYLGKKGGGLMIVLCILCITIPIPLIMAIVDFYKIISGKMEDGEGKIVTYWATNE
jgi:TM2 domain-containing membrane protein YozV